MASSLAAAADADFVRYATFTRRARAVLIDSAIVGFSIGAVIVLADLASGVPGAGRIAWLLLVCIGLYEPIFVSRRGATIGHAANRLVVIADGTSRPPSFPRALARFVAKVPLGIVGFVTMATTRRHQAVHDLLTGTTVQLSSAAGPDADFHVERAHVTDDELPSRTRRVFVIVGYVIVLFLAYGRVVAASLSDDCVRDGVCSDAARTFAQAVFAIALTVSAGAVVAGWRGMLPGARSRRASVVGNGEHPEHADEE